MEALTKEGLSKEIEVLKNSITDQLAEKDAKGGKVI